MSDMSSQFGAAGGGARLPEIRTIRADAPWVWLARGWADMSSVPAISLAYGVGFFLISLLLVCALFLFNLGALVPVMAAGFLLVGPMLAVGMYEASRRVEADLPVRLADVAFVSTRSPAQLAFLGAMLMGAMLIWVRIATLLFALFFGTQTMPQLDEFVPALLLTPHGLGLLVVGTVVGGALAFICFAISVVSVPMLMARDVDAVTAALTSIETVRRNFWPMMIWGWIIAFFTAFGIATLFVGLIVVFPLLGHATWHAYRALVAES
ncbi:MAG: DUF2189 domain-containing protein [Parvibaculum sp.]|uniref:DUF2189 domain-containing protein n=1 Tax=Parvibaculum sp. TaxID=2024848 RepID=UPI0034A09DFB